jgi:hypothetical protein
VNLPPQVQVIAHQRQCLKATVQARLGSACPSVVDRQGLERTVSQLSPSMGCSSRGRGDSARFPSFVPGARHRANREHCRQTGTTGRSIYTALHDLLSRTSSALLKELGLWEFGERTIKADLYGHRRDREGAATISLAVEQIDVIPISNL